jgi:cholesterol transport system auxiliary component
VRSCSAAARTLPLLCLCLAGCSGLFQSKAKPEQIYFLRAPAVATAAPAPQPADSAAATRAAPAAPMPASLRVTRPLASPGLDTSHIMLVQSDHRMNFFSGSRWPAPVTQLVEALAVETLRATGAWGAVQDSTSPFPSDYLLQIHVRRFEADYTEGSGGAPVVQVVFDCVVGRRQGREVLATFTAAGSAAAIANRQAEVVAAFEQATGTALQALSQQAEQAVRADLQRGAQNADKPVASIRR